MVGRRMIGSVRRSNMEFGIDVDRLGPVFPRRYRAGARLISPL